MAEEEVIDTNVLVIANTDSAEVSPSCVEECVSYLRRIQESGRVHLDSGRLILSEYKGYCSFSGQPGVGDRFFLWLHQNQANPDKVCVTDITPHDERGFEEFPDSAALVQFDPADRKFVALALGCAKRPIIANAADKGWVQYQDDLRAEGIDLRLLCLRTRRMP